MSAHLGLTTAEATSRLKTVGANQIRDVNQNGPLKILLRTITKNFIIYLLVAAAIISYFIGEPITSAAIGLVLIIIISISFFQDYRAEQAVQALKEMMTPITVVIRDGHLQQISSVNLVPGDLIVLKTGERVPADASVIEASNLQLNESILTGESREVAKQLNDQLFMGSFVVNGRSKAIVTQTGMSTKFGQIASLISTTEKSLPLQDKVNRLAKYMVFVAIAVSVATGLLMVWQTPQLDLVAFSGILVVMIAIAVSAFPEGLPVVLVTSLALGATRMAKHNAIVNRMSIIETLGETTIICADKTGTITTGEMTVKQIQIANAIIEVDESFTQHHRQINPSHHPSLIQLLKTVMICNDASIERTPDGQDYKVIGTPTEGALLISAAKANLFKEEIDDQRISEQPFNSSRKMMSVLVKEGDHTTVYAKGALEVLLQKCHQHLVDNTVKPLTESDRQNILNLNANLTNQSFRTIAAAYKPHPSTDPNYTEDNLIFLGLLGLEDPPREEMQNALQQCYQAGITVKMITGDNLTTALAVANQIGLKGEAIQGTEIDQLSDQELMAKLPTLTIFARVRPEHKLRIVKILKAMGEVVTMTGDGVNDAPALKEAQIGVAMGRNGTDVSRSVADLTLLDDNFATIVIAIREGRTIFNNIRKFVAYTLSCTWAELAVLFGGVLLAPILGWQIPILVAIQILFLNLVVDDLPALTLGLNRSSTDVLREKPRRKAQILDRRAIFLMVVTAFLIATLTLITYYIVFNILGESVEIARTTALATIIIIQLLAAFNFRSLRYLTLTRSPFINPYLLYASLISLAATLAIIYIPFLAHLFEVVPIPASDWLIGIGCGLIFVLIIDWTKHLYHRKSI